MTDDQLEQQLDEVAIQPEISTEPTVNIPTISDLSLKINHLQLSANGNPLGTATGTVINYHQTFYLLTNWHVLSGRYPYSGQPISKHGGVPDKLTITYLSSDHRNKLQTTVDLLSEDRSTLWIQHQDGQDVDLAAVQLPTQLGLALWPFDLSLVDADMKVRIGMTIFIIGFPYGVASYMDTLPIWKTGHIASEPDLTYAEKQAFLIDATTREGMSGSPVIARTDGVLYPRDGSGVILTQDTVTRFLGIYSGRLDFQTGEKDKLSSELGVVWKPQTIYELLDKQLPGNFVIRS
jgi:hypothetical protein